MVHPHATAADADTNGVSRRSVFLITLLLLGVGAAVFAVKFLEFVGHQN
jgi:hypothetical protein